MLKPVEVSAPIKPNNSFLCAIITLKPTTATKIVFMIDLIYAIYFIITSILIDTKQAIITVPHLIVFGIVIALNIALIILNIVLLIIKR